MFSDFPRGGGHGRMAHQIRYCLQIQYMRIFNVNENVIRRAIIRFKVEIHQSFLSFICPCSNRRCLNYLFKMFRGTAAFLVIVLVLNYELALGRNIEPISKSSVSLEKREGETMIICIQLCQRNAVSCSAPLI